MPAFLMMTCRRATREADPHSRRVPPKLAGTLRACCGQRSENDGRRGSAQSWFRQPAKCLTVTFICRATNSPPRLRDSGSRLRTLVALAAAATLLLLTREVRYPAWTTRPPPWPLTRGATHRAPPARSD